MLRMQCEDVKSLILSRPTGVKIGSAILVTALASYLKFRPIALIVSVSYCTWVYKTFYSNYKIYISPELVARCKDFYENASNLRKNKPHVFCGFVSSILFLVSIIGHAIDGAYLLIVCLIGGVLLTSRYDIKLVKEFDSDSRSCNKIDVEEFIPRLDESSSKILEQLSDHGDDNDNDNTPPNAFQSEHNSDNELLPPTIDSVYPELDFDLRDDDNSTVLTSSAEYRRKHFSNTSSDSSDSDSDSIARGLELRNIPVIATIEPQSTSSNLIEKRVDTSTFKSSQPQKSKAYESEDEISDFEFLEKDDLCK